MKGMYCSKCAEKVNDAIKTVKHVKNIEVDLKHGRVKVTPEDNKE